MARPGRAGLANQGRVSGAVHEGRSTCGYRYRGFNQGLDFPGDSTEGFCPHICHFTTQAGLHFINFWANHRISYLALIYLILTTHMKDSKEFNFTYIPFFNYVNKYNLPKS